MSRLDEPVDPASVYEVAGMVLDHHAAGGTCQACTEQDCAQTVWALGEVAAHHARRGKANLARS